MRKVLKVMGITVFILVVLIIILLVYLSKRPAVATGYYKSQTTGGEIEAKYLEQGTYTEVERKEIKALSSYKKYIMYYPKEMETSDNTFPAVIFSNGTGVKVSKYESQLKRLATWGFIAIGTEEEHSWNGFSSEMCLRLIIKLNETKSITDWESNPFYMSVDLDHIGVVGHSQGGVGVINAATENKNGTMIKTIVSLSPTNRELVKNLEWDYDSAKIQVPTLFISATGDLEENAIVSGEQLKDIYNSIEDDVLKVKMRRNNVDHGDMLAIADGYVTAWLMWQLQGDEEARFAFEGEWAEILENEWYEGVEKNF